MSDPILTFSKANSVKSRQIYRLFCNKTVVNKKVYLESKASFVDHDLYIEIIENQNHYENLYFHIGYLLSHDQEGEYFYIKSVTENDDSDESYDESSLKIMSILILFAKIAIQRQQSIETLGEPIQGVTASDLGQIDRNDEMLNVIKSLKLKDASETLEVLRKNGFAFKVLPNRYVLSKGSMVMIKTLIEHFKP